MAHEFESGFVVREAAWHGLATVLTDVPSIEAGIIEAGMDWEVTACPIRVLTGTSHGQDQYIEASGWQANVRASDSSVLGIVSDKYKILQNKEAFGWFQPFIDNGTCALESAGSLKSGKFVWVLAKIQGREAEVTDGDRLESYLLLSNSHDGSRAITVAFTGIRVVCWNTLSSAHSIADKNADKKTGQATRVLHVGDMRKNLDDVQKVIDVAARKMIVIAETARELQKREIDEASFYKYLENVYAPERDDLRKRLKAVYTAVDNTALSDEARKEAKTMGMEIEEKLATPFRKDSTIMRLGRLFAEGPGSEMAGKTLWGALSAVTHYEEHERPGSNEARLASSWMGGATAKMRDQALLAAVNMF